MSHDGWRALIERAEDHSYFRGQIEFLLDFCGAVAAASEHNTLQWDDSLHTDLQAKFERYLSRAN